MGILFSCFRWPTADEEDEVTNRGDNHLGRETIRPKGKKDSMHHQQKQDVPGSRSEPKPEPEPRPEPEPVLESNGLITCKSNLREDSISSRDEECPICFEGYTSENPRITTTCLHHFHLGCIYDWQERSGLCPSCLKVMEFQEMS